MRDLAARKSIHIQGTMMTFTEDPDFDKEQLRRFIETCASLEKEGITLGKKHSRLDAERRSGPSFTFLKPRAN